MGRGISQKVAPLTHLPDMLERPGASIDLDARGRHQHIHIIRETRRDAVSLEVEQQSAHLDDEAFGNADADSRRVCCGLLFVVAEYHRRQTLIL